jgi:hypothetical protein
MSIRDDVLGHLAKGPAKTSEIADALSLEIAQVSPALSAMKNEGRVARDAETQEWSLASGRGNGSVEVLPSTHVRRVPAKKPQAPSYHEEVAESLEQQTIWAEKALEQHLTALGDNRTKVLVDNVLAAKAAQLQWTKES